MSPTVINNLMAHFQTPAKAACNPFATAVLAQVENAIAELDQARAVFAQAQADADAALVSIRNLRGEERS